MAKPVKSMLPAGPLLPSKKMQLPELSTVAPNLSRKPFEIKQQIKKALNKRFFTQETGNYAGGAQTANAFALFLEIVPEEHVETVVENLVNDIKKENYHLTTGPQGPRYVIQSLRMHEQNEVASGLPPLYDPALMRESSSGDPLACRSGAGR